jgi:AraC-like DNA-binding protein
MREHPQLTVIPSSLASEFIRLREMSGFESDNQNLIPLMKVSDLREVLLEGGHDDKSISRVCSLAGLPEHTLANPKGHLSLNTVWKLFSANVSILGDSLSGLGSQKLGVGATEIITSRAMHEANFGDALIAFADASNTVAPDLKLKVRQRHGGLHFSVIFPDGMTAARQTFLEIVSLYWHCIFCWFLGELPPVIRVSTSAFRKGTRTHVMSSFGCPILFSGAGIELVYAKGLSKQSINPPPLKNYRSEVFTILDRLIEAHQDGVNNDGVLNYVRRALQSGVSNQATIAASAGMSVATLRRRLALSGTDFRTQKYKSLGDQALQLIQQGKTADEIAERLGYSEARSFRRAFQSQFGESPSEYRDRLSIEPEQE